MTQENKYLLLKDLCSRLPYGVKVRYSSYYKFITCTLQAIDYAYNTVDLWSKDACFNPVDISKIKPYLFPLSSMNEEQKEEFNTKSLELQLKVIDDEIMYEKATEFQVDFYNKHHLDWRGLIPMGLAIDATDLNIY